MSERTRKAALLGAIFLLALAARLAHLGAIAGTALFELPLGDAAAFDRWAQAIAGGDWIGSGTFYVSPLYPYLLGSLWALFGRDLLLVRLLQAAFSAAAVVLVADAAQRLFGRVAAIASGLFLALYAPWIFHDGLLQKSTLDLVLVSAIVWLVSRVDESDWRLHLGLGLAAGALALNRENALLLLPLLAIWMVRARGRRAAAWLVAGSAAVLLPVAARNFVVGGELALTTSQLGPNLYYGNHEGADGTYAPFRAGRGSQEFERRDATAIAERAEGRKLTPGEVSAYWRRRAADWMTSRPGSALALLGRKVVLAWGAGETMDTEDIYSYAAISPLLAALLPLFHFGVLAPLALAGLWTARSRLRRLWILPAILALYSAALALFFVLGRYRLPLVPILALFLGAFAAWVATEFRARRPRAVVASFAAVVLVALWNLPRIDRDAMRARTAANLASALSGSGRKPEAVTAYRRSLALAPGSARVTATLGTLHAELGERDEAEKCARRALELDGAEPAAHNLVGTLVADTDPALAAKAFARAVELDPESSDYAFNLGTALTASGELETGRAALARSVELDPECARCRNNLGIALAREGRVAAAASEFRLALAAEPQNREIRRNLERALALASGG